MSLGVVVVIVVHMRSGMFTRRVRGLDLSRGLSARLSHRLTLAIGRTADLVSVALFHYILPGFSTCLAGHSPVVAVLGIVDCHKFAPQLADKCTP